MSERQYDQAAHHARIIEEINAWCASPLADNAFRAQLVNLCAYLEGWKGRHPFQIRTVICSVCKKPVHIFHAYRCYDCGTWAHKDCLRHHCEESKKRTAQVQDSIERGHDLPDELIEEEPHTL